MTDAAVEMLMESLRQTREDMNRRFDEQSREINHRFDEANQKIAEVKSDTSATNGRVRKLEIWKAHVEGFRAAFHWAEVVAGALAASGTTVVLTHIL